MSRLPVGTVTLLFTDIEGSTRLLQHLGERYSEVLAECRRLLRAAVEQGGGKEVDAPGDAFFAAFPSARDAAGSAVSAQRAILKHPWPEGVSVLVRMGLHTGEPAAAVGGYIGMDIHRAARICASGHGGQILLSETTASLVRDELPPRASLIDLGEHRLKDLPPTCWRSFPMGSGWWSWHRWRIPTWCRKPSPRPCTSASSPGGPSWPRCWTPCGTGAC